MDRNDWDVAVSRASPKKTKKRRSKQDGQEEVMLDALGESVSAKERTRNRFEQLLKAALEDANKEMPSAKSSKPKRSTKRSDVGLVGGAEHGVAVAAVREIQQETEFGVEVKKSTKGKIKKKRRKDDTDDTEGLINPAFDCDERVVAATCLDTVSKSPVRRRDNCSKQRTTRTAAEGRLPTTSRPSVGGDAVGPDDEEPLAAASVADVHRTQNEFGSESDSEGSPEEPVFGGASCVAEEPTSPVMTPPSGQKQAVRKGATFELAAGLSVHKSDGDQGEIVSVKVHRADRLKMNFAIKHPLVRVHVVDGRTGSYLEKRDRGRSVTAVYENRNAKVTYVLPVMTQPFDLKQRRSLVPAWDEALLLNEPFDHFVHQETNAILFFEILDFLPMAVACGQYAHLGVDSGWYRVAWAFLKLVGANGVLNTDRKVQLQLYCPPKQRLRLEPRVVDVFHWWSSLPRVRYPATLHITVGRVHAPVDMEPVLRSSAPMQEERGSALPDGDGAAATEEHRLRMDGPNSVTSSPQKNAAPAPLSWSRLPGQSCKVPNRLLLHLPTAKKGCLSACFAHNGRWIACGCHDGAASPIIVYEIPSGRRRGQVSGHDGLIYEVHFSKSDDRLVSAAADGTARIWPVNGGELGEACATLPHPSYVYTARFHPVDSRIVATGCYDTVVRLWSVATVDRHGQLLQELEGHRANVNSVCFGERGTTLFSGDGKGVVHVWTAGRNGDVDSASRWTLHRQVADADLAGVSISLLAPHPTLPRLVVQGQDGAIRMFDMQSFQVLRRYDGYLNVREYVRGCLTPCGNLLLTGGEDGCVNAWNVVTGDRVAVYSDLPCGRTVHCVVFHPLDHLVAFCSCGDGGSPVVIYHYDHCAPQLEVSRVQTVDGARFPDRLVPLSSKAASPQGRPGLSSTPTADPMTDAGSESIFKKIMRRLDSVLKAPQNQSQSGLVESPSLPGWGSTFDGLNINPNAPVIQKVVALYDYDACRSDEALFRKGDVIDILCKESDEWWIGKTGDGQCGYVPANHLVDTDGDVVQAVSSLHPHGAVVDDLSEPDSKPREVTAILTKSGHLTFISASEEEDGPVTSTPNKRQRRRRRKDWELHAAQFEQSDV